MLEEIREKFPEYGISELNKGWSKDRKFILEGADERFTLRCSQDKTLDHQRAEYEVIGSIPRKDCIIRPAGYGTLNGNWTYILYTYVEGRDLKEVITALPAGVQYDLGIQAGCTLKRIHQVKGGRDEEFESYFLRKIQRKIKGYREAKMEVPGMEEHISFIEHNRHLLKGRPTVLQHGDYHLGNMVLQDQKVQIIDFNRYDFGDPYEEFNRMTMNSRYSKEFARGMLHGYFQGTPPMEFFSLLKLYVLTNAVGSISWAIHHSPESMEFVLEMIHETLKDYEDPSSPIPGWYKELLDYA
jgi:serine/threonine-protein kinase